MLISFGIPSTRPFCHLPGTCYHGLRQHQPVCSLRSLKTAWNLSFSLKYIFFDQLKQVVKVISVHSIYSVFLNATTLIQWHNIQIPTIRSKLENERLKLVLKNKQKIMTCQDGKRGSKTYRLLPLINSKIWTSMFGKNWLTLAPPNLLTFTVQ